MFEDIVRTRRPPITVLGFGQETVESWLTDIVRPVADIAKQYLDVKVSPETQQFLASTPTPTIKPIYLIGGGLVLWWLLRGGLKGKKLKRR